MSYTAKKFVKSLKWCLRQGPEVPGMSREAHLLGQLSKILHTGIYEGDGSMDLQLRVEEEGEDLRIFVRGPTDSKGMLFLLTHGGEIRREIERRDLPLYLNTESYPREGAVDSAPQATQEAPVRAPTP